MNEHFIKIKQELQGNRGLIKAIRQRHLPSTEKMAKVAQLEFESSNEQVDDVDNALEQLLTFEYRTYLGKENEIIEKFIEYADADASVLSFPEVRKVIDEYAQSATTPHNRIHSLRGIINIIIALADSNRQSRVSRSGSSLMHHISYLLQRKGFVFKQDFQREFVLKNGCKLDFFFPSLEAYNEEPKNCCAVACQTTSNDRFRLTFGQMPKNTRNRACTAIGSENFGKNLGPSSLSDNKLEEAKRNDVKFVIIRKGIDERLRQSKAVISYSDWFQELESLKSFW